MGTVMKRAGIFGGSFDPIHFGHIALIIEVLEKLDLEKIFVIPASISPHKLEKPPKAKPRDRFEMTRRALSDINALEVLDLEVARGGTSYTIDTVRALKEKGDYKFFLITTIEALDRFHSWKDYSKLISLTSPIIASRGAVFQEELPEGISKKNLLDTKRFDISSTDIRDRLKKKLYVKHLLPKEVLDYIIENNLY